MFPTYFYMDIHREISIRYLIQIVFCVGSVSCDYLIDFSDCFRNGPADLSAMQANRACQKLDRPWKSECRSRFGIAICLLPEWKLSAEYAAPTRYPILDIRLLYTPVAYIRVPRAENFAIQRNAQCSIFIIGR